MARDTIAVMATDYRAIADTLDADIVASTIDQFARTPLVSSGSIASTLFDRTHEGLAALSFLIAAYQSRSTPVHGSEFLISELSEPDITEKALQWARELGSILGTPPHARTGVMLDCLGTLAWNMEHAASFCRYKSNRRMFIVGADRATRALKGRPRRRHRWGAAHGA